MPLLAVAHLECLGRISLEIAYSCRLRSLIRRPSLPFRKDLEAILLALALEAVALGVVGFIFPWML